MSCLGSSSISHMAGFGEVAGATYMSCLRGAIFRMAVCALEYVALFCVRRMSGEFPSWLLRSLHCFFGDSRWNAHFAHIKEQRIFMKMYSIDAWRRGLVLTFCLCLWVMNRKFQVLPDMVWLAVALAIPQRNIVELRSTLIRGASMRNDSMTTSRISVFDV